MKPSTSAPAEAATLFAAGYNCAQSVCTAFAPALGLPRGKALQVTAAMGGGMGRQGDVCGAVSGAVIVLGLRRGQNLEQDAANNRPAYAAAEEFVRRFKERHKSIVCRELLRCDMSTDAGWKQFRSDPAYREICAGLVRSAAEILEEMGE